ncbi:glutamate--tRNA ligase [Candidatus Woesearchaeota archaeon]|nr:glutamate--tRNA ligase [Candidatus Woesearchaeota archaeon]
MDKLIEAYALQNALQYNGKANLGAVIGKILALKPELKHDIKSVSNNISRIVQQINKLSVKEQEQEFEKLSNLIIEQVKIEKEALKPLPNPVVGAVVLRFAPSPSGALHIGHAFVLSLNYLYSKKYNGKLYLRIEDTNPENIYSVAYELIENDAKWLAQNNLTEVIIQSDRLGIYYDYVERMISSGKAYVCVCNLDQFRELINKKQACPCRNLQKQEHLSRWQNMFGKYKPGEAVVRIKTDLNDKNPAMRDWPAMRINDHVHPKAGTKNRVWPLMNFAVAIDDYELKVSHTIRGKDHIDNAKRQKHIFDFFQWPTTNNLYFGRINFEGLSLSASEIRLAIERGEYNGWEDIRLPFLPALRRRGYQPEAFHKYAVNIGLSQVDKTVSAEEFFKALNSFNREIIEEKANRYFFIEHPIEVKIIGASKQKVSLELHPNYPNRGNRIFETKDEFYLSKQDYDELKINNLYRLMDCLNFKKSKDVLEFDSKEYNHYKEHGEKIMHWLPKNEKLVNIEVLMPDGTEKKGLGETGLRKLKQGDIIQFERFGFVRLDQKSKNKIMFWYLHN